MISNALDIASQHYFNTYSSRRDLLVRVASGGRISLMVGIAVALVASPGGEALRCAVRLSRRQK